MDPSKKPFTIRSFTIHSISHSPCPQSHPPPAHLLKGPGLGYWIVSAPSLVLGKTHVTLRLIRPSRPQAGLPPSRLARGVGKLIEPPNMGVSQNGTYHDIPPIPMYHQICFLSKFQFWSLQFFSQLCPLKLPQIGCKSPDLGQRHSEFPLPSQPEFPPQPEFPLPSASCAAKFFSSCTLAACSHDFNGQLVALVLWNLEGGWIVIILTKRESIGNPGFRTQNYKYQISRIWFCNDERASAKSCYIMSVANPCLHQA